MRKVNIALGFISLIGFFLFAPDTAYALSYCQCVQVGHGYTWNARWTVDVFEMDNGITVKWADATAGPTPCTSPVSDINNTSYAGVCPLASGLTVVQTDSCNTTNYVMNPRPAWNSFLPVQEDASCDFSDINVTLVGVPSGYRCKHFHLFAGANSQSIALNGSCSVTVPNGWIGGNMEFEIEKVISVDPTTGLRGQCDVGGTMTVFWDDNLSADYYSLRFNNPDDPWDGTCSSPTGDFCYDTPGRTTSYTFLPIAPDASYGWWMHARKITGEWEMPPAIGPFLSCANPIGVQDQAICNGFSSFTSGWACDLDDPNQFLNIDMWSDGPRGGGGVHQSPGAVADITTLKYSAGFIASQCGGVANHEFIWDTHDSLVNGEPHDIYAYAENVGIGIDTLLPIVRRMQCFPPLTSNPIVVCDPVTSTAELSWFNPQPTANTFYSVRADNTTNPWDIDCIPGPNPNDVCEDTSPTAAYNPNNFYTIPVVLGDTYNWWVSARSITDLSGWSDAVGGTFTCPAVAGCTLNGTDTCVDMASLGSCSNAPYVALGVCDDSTPPSGARCCTLGPPPTTCANFDPLATCVNSADLGTCNALPFPYDADNCNIPLNNSRCCVVGGGGPLSADFHPFCTIPLP